MIRTLIVEDSPTAQSLLTFILSKDPDIEVIGIASNGDQAVKRIKWYRPDVVLMDYQMPIMNGLEATRLLMESYPVPIIIVSATLNSSDVKDSFRAIEAGAVAVLQKPVGINHPRHRQMAQELIRTIKLMSEIKVVRRWHNRRQNALQQKALDGLNKNKKVQILAMGASTGGPPAIQWILRQLTDFPVPILIVQHITPGFLDGFADWLQRTCPLNIQIAKDGAPLLPKNVYLAPDGCHLGVKRPGVSLLSDSEPENGLRPAVSFLFRSVAQVYGQNAVGILLTGMGKDGAKELKLLRQKGAITIVQDEESSVVWGMPGEASRIGAATHTLPIEQIGRTLNELVNCNKNALTTV